MNSCYLFFWQECWRLKPLGLLTLERWSTWELTVSRTQQGYSHSTQTLIHTSKNTQTRPYSTKILKVGVADRRSNASVEREERRCDSQTNAVSITPQTEKTGVIILNSSAGSKANRDPRRDHLRSWRMWPECTSYDFAGCAGSACLWSQLHSWHLAGPGGPQTQTINSQNYLLQSAIWDFSQDNL